jgi:hypothetical protein
MVSPSIVRAMYGSSSAPRAYHPCPVYRRIHPSCYPPALLVVVVVCPCLALTLAGAVPLVCPLPSPGVGGRFVLRSWLVYGWDPATNLRGILGFGSVVV